MKRMVKKPYLTNAWLKDQVPGMTYEEEMEAYNEILSRVAENPRFYLDHLEELPVVRFTFIYYPK